MKEYINVDKDGIVISKGSHNFEGFIEVDKNTVELGDYFIEGKVNPDKRKRKDKENEIRDSFTDNFVNGKFMSETLGIEVDCRRNGKDNDLQNVQNLIEDMTEEGETSVDYVGYTEIKQGVTIDQLKKLLKEMRKYGRGTYTKKVMLQEQIKGSSLKDLDNIKW
jgi:hypothetical protein